MTPTPPAATRPALTDRLKRLVEEYGKIGIIVYVVLCLLNFGGVYLAMQFGWRPESVVGQGATLGAAYFVYKLSMPVRIGAAVLVTPILAKLAGRFARTPPPRA